MQQIPERQGDALFASRTECWLFTRPESCIVCERPETLPACLDAADAALAQGKYIAGFIAYEAGWALLERPVARRDPAVPLLWFGVYNDRASVAPPRRDATRANTEAAWRPRVSYATYQDRMRRIRAYIASGDSYQVNFTLPLDARFNGDPFAWFEELYTAQPTDHAAYLDLGATKILSLSPELFFQLSGDLLTARPMKGTMPRGLYAADDQRQRARLEASEKDRAENLMIVDLLRNDMGRVSRTGSVAVPRLFDIERYATVWQMTSTITSRCDAPFSEILRALFPCGSVTGAPKIRTMEIIDEIESHPRGVYCGAVGWWGPRRQALFNVAIRTITLDTRAQTARYPVGGGITWDSSAEGEYAECLTKAAVLTRPIPEFELLESLLFEDGAYYLLEEHLDRVCASADYFSIPCSREGLRQGLLDAATAHASGAWKMRLLVARSGAWRITVEAAPTKALTRVALAEEPVSTGDIFLYHKTTCRATYDKARAAHPEADDVLLWNERGELTESALANIVADMGDRLVTPPVSCGLLPGVMRAWLLQAGIIEEAVIPVDRMGAVKQLYLINSVRKWMPVQMKVYA